MQPIMITSAQDVYKKQSVMTASPVELIVMLYEGLKKNLLLAKRAIAKHDPAGAHSSLMKAQAIVAELINSLDMNIDMSGDLLAIYEFLLNTMGEANIKKDAALLDPALEIITELKGAWEAVSAAQHGTMALEG